MAINPYDRMGDYIYRLGHYIFAATSRCENLDQFTKFIEFVANKEWNFFDMQTLGDREINSPLPPGPHVKTRWLGGLEGRSKRSTPEV
jgi:hypothetical protein